MGLINMSCVASVGCAAYVIMAVLNMYRLMNPLWNVDLSVVYPPSTTAYAKPLWNDAHSDTSSVSTATSTTEESGLAVYLSELESFSLDFLDSGSSAVLLWETYGIPTDTSIITAEDEWSKSFVLTTKTGTHDADTCDAETGVCLAGEEPEVVEEGWNFSLIVAAFHVFFPEVVEVKEKATLIQVPEDGVLWQRAMTNGTLYVHAVVMKGGKATPQVLSSSSGESKAGGEEAILERKQFLSRLHKSHALLHGGVPLTKYDDVKPEKPKRLLYRDLFYLFEKYILSKDIAAAPWAFDTNERYQTQLSDEASGLKYPYWKPEVAIKLVPDGTIYPAIIAQQSGFQMVNLRSPKNNRGTNSDAGYGYLPPLHVDEIGLTSEKYLPLNKTLTRLPLKLTFDTMSIQRYRLMTHLSHSLDSQTELGFEASDIDDIRRLIADTNVTLLAITMLASILHLLFEFLTFKSEVEFWKSNKDLTGLSVRALFLDCFGQIIILLYLMEQDSSLLMTVPSFFGILIAMWKCQRAAGFVLTRQGLLATRLQSKSTTTTNIDDSTTENDSKTKKSPSKKDDGQQKKDRLNDLTREMDKKATNTLGKVLGPCVLAFTLRSLFVEEYSGWYSWFITSASGTIYALGFVLMTPQLFLNYKLKSVAHLPWRVLCYKFLNTFIDDLFAFIIRMPTMARISCFRDDVVFLIYLGQRYAYDVDTSRPVEGGAGGQ